jgi:hypothetical protein
MTKTGKPPFKHWDIACISTLFVLTIILFSSFFFSDDIFVASDRISNIDMAQYTTDGLVNHGQMPTWFSTRLAGMPSIDAMFSDALYPVSLVMRPFVPAHRLYGFTMVFHIFLAGMFFFLMLRRSFAVSHVVAFAGALFFMLNPQFVTHLNPGHDGKMFVIAWLPFVVWRLRSLLYLPSLRNATLMATGVAMMILSPHVQMAYFVLMGLFLYWATDIVKAIVDKVEKKQIIYKAAFFWVAVFIGLGLSSIILYPSYMFISNAFSVRGVDRGFEFAASWPLNWAEFFSLWIHEFGNALQYYWGKNWFKLNTEYAGAVPLLLTFLAIASKPKSLWRIFWAGIAIMAVLFSLGANTPFFALTYYTIPGINRFRAPSMMMFWFTFSTALMAAFFIKDLLAKRFDIDGEQKRKWVTGLFAVIGGVTLLSILFSIESIATSFAAPMMGDGDASRIFKLNYEQNFVPNLWLWWLFSVVIVGLLIAVINGKIKAISLVYALILISTIDMVKVNNQFIKLDSPWKYFYRNDPTLDELKNEFAKVPFRVFSLPRTFPMQNQEGVYGLEGVGGFHDNELVFYREFRGDQSDIHYLADIAEIRYDGQMRLSVSRLQGNTPFLDLANVGYILMNNGAGGIGKMKNPTNLGRLSYASDYTVMPEELIIDALRSRRYDYRTTVALVEEPELPFTPRWREQPVDADKDQHVNDDIVTDGETDEVELSADAADDDVDNQMDMQIAVATIDNTPKELKVEWKKYTSNKRIAAVTMPDDGFLRISEVYYPGWRIKINGEPVKYYRSDMAWMAVPLKAGDYEVTMEPRSLYLHGAAYATLFFTLFVIAVLAVGFVVRRRGKALKSKSLKSKSFFGDRGSAPVTPPF